MKIASKFSNFSQLHTTYLFTERGGQLLVDNERKSISVEKTFPRKKRHEKFPKLSRLKVRGTFFCLLMRVKVCDDDSEQKLKLTKPIQVHIMKFLINAYLRSFISQKIVPMLIRHCEFFELKKKIFRNRFEKLDYLQHQICNQEFSHYIT